MDWDKLERAIWPFLQAQWSLCLLWVVTLGLLVVEERKLRAEGQFAWSPAQLVGRLNRGEVVLLDCRTETEFQAGHMRGATWVAETTLNPEHKVLRGNKPVLIYCQRGVRSLAVVQRLRRAGVAEVYSLAGGLQGWQADDMPVVQGKKSN